MFLHLPETAKGPCDTTAVLTAVLAFFNLIPWPNIAAFLAALYTAIRIVEYLYNVLRNNGKH